LGPMLKRVFVFVFIGALFFVGLQFASVYFYAWEFDDFVRDELKFELMRERHTDERLVAHIIEQAQFYGLRTDKKNVRIQQHKDTTSGVSFLVADVNYSTPVDLFYFTYQLHRHVHASSVY